MDDSNWGSEDKRGYWHPKDLIKYPDVFIWPPKVMGIVRWLPKYVFPWLVAYAALSVVVFLFLTPSVERMQSFSLDWIGLIFLRNLGLHIAIVGAQHYWLYTKQKQGTGKRLSNAQKKSNKKNKQAAMAKKRRKR